MSEPYTDFRYDERAQALVEMLVATDAPPATIKAFIERGFIGYEISDEDFRQAFAFELAHGKTKIKLRLLTKLFRTALDGKDIAAIRAANLFLQRLWPEQDLVDHADPPTRDKTLDAIRAKLSKYLPKDDDNVVPLKG